MNLSKSGKGLAREGRALLLLLLLTTAEPAATTTSGGSAEATRRLEPAKTAR